MDMIDHYAHSNAIRCVAPAQKGGLALLALGLCLLLDHPLVGLLTVGWMLAFTVYWARVPARVFGQVMLAQSLFLAISTIGIVLSGGLGAAPSGMTLQMGPLWLGVDPQASATGIRLVARALGCAAALNFLILTTPLVDLIELLRRLRAPELLIDLMTLTYRAIFVLLESVKRMPMAHAPWRGYTAPRQALSSAAQIAGALFVDAYQRGLHLQRSLERCGINPTLRVPSIVYTYDARVWWLSAAMAASLLLAGLSQ